MLPTSRGAALSASLSRVGGPGREKRRRVRRRKNRKHDDSPVYGLALRYARSHRDALTLRELIKMVGDHVSGLPVAHKLHALAVRAMAASVASPLQFFGDDGLARPDMEWWSGAASDWLTQNVIQEEAGLLSESLLRARVIIVRFIGACPEKVEEHYVKRSDRGLDDVRYALKRVCELWEALPEACYPAALLGRRHESIEALKKQQAANSASLDDCFATIADATAVESMLLDYADGTTAERRLIALEQLTAKMLPVGEKLREEIKEEISSDMRKRLAVLWSQRCRLEEAAEKLASDLQELGGAVLGHSNGEITWHPAEPTMLLVGSSLHLASLKQRKRLAAVRRSLRSLDKNLLSLARTKKEQVEPADTMGLIQRIKQNQKIIGRKQDTPKPVVVKEEEPSPRNPAPPSFEAELCDRRERAEASLAKQRDDEARRRAELQKALPDDWPCLLPDDLRWARESASPLEAFSLRHLGRRSTSEDLIIATLCPRRIGVFEGLEQLARREGASIDRALAADTLNRVVDAVVARDSSNAVFARECFEAAAPTPRTMVKIIDLGEAQCQGHFAIIAEAPATSAATFAPAPAPADAAPAAAPSPYHYHHRHAPAAAPAAAPYHHHAPASSARAAALAEAPYHHEAPASSARTALAEAPYEAPASSLSWAPAAAAEEGYFSFLGPAPAPATVGDEQQSVADLRSSLHVRVGRGLAALLREPNERCLAAAREAAQLPPLPLEAALLAVYIVHGGVEAQDVVDTALRIIRKQARPLEGTPFIVVSRREARRRRRGAALAERRLRAGQEASISAALASAALDPRGRCAIHAAAAAGDVDLVSALKARGANANRRDFQGDIPAHLATSTRVSRSLRWDRPPLEATPALLLKGYNKKAALRQVDWTVRLMLRDVEITAKCSLYDLRHKRLFFQDPSCSFENLNEPLEAVVEFESCDTNVELFECLSKARGAQLQSSVFDTLLDEILDETLDKWTSTARNRLQEKEEAGRQPAPAPTEQHHIFEAPVPAPFHHQTPAPAPLDSPTKDTIVLQEEEVRPLSEDR